MVSTDPIGRTSAIEEKLLEVCGSEALDLIRRADELGSPAHDHGLDTSEEIQRVISGVSLMRTASLKFYTASMADDGLRCGEVEEYLEANVKRLRQVLDAWIGQAEIEESFHHVFWPKTAK